jgi:DNA-binding transcriptional MerR regulator
MKIRELAERTQVAKETIHYYVREGVLRKPRKTAKNVADYNESHIEQIRIIKRLQDDYFLPLTVIKKIIKQQRKQSRSEKSSFQFLSEYFRPIDRLLCREVKGKAAFCQATGISERWLRKMEAWGVITSETNSGGPVYSQDDVIIGRLLVDMDRIGFGPQDGYDPEDLRHIADFVREFVIKGQREYYQFNLERLSSQEFAEKGSKFTEIMSLFFYHLYRKVVKEEYRRLLKSTTQSTVAPAGVRRKEEMLEREKTESK